MLGFKPKPLSHTLPQEMLASSGLWVYAPIRRADVLGIFSILGKLSALVARVVLDAEPLPFPSVKRGW